MRVAAQESHKRSKQDTEEFERVLSIGIQSHNPVQAPISGQSGTGQKVHGLGNHMSNNGVGGKSQTPHHCLQQYQPYPHLLLQQHQPCPHLLLQQYQPCPHLAPTVPAMAQMTPPPTLPVKMDMMTTHGLVPNLNMSTQMMTKMSAQT